MGIKAKYDPLLCDLVSDHGFGDRITGMEDTYVRLEIFEEVSSTSGTLAVPTGAIIVMDQFAQDVDALCTVIPTSGQKPEEELERTTGGDLVTVTLSGTGNADYALSGTPVGIQYAVQYVVDIKFIDLPNVDRDIVLTADEVNAPFDVIKFNTTSTHQVEEGEMAWNSNDGTVNVGMPGGNVVGQMFQELYVPKRPRNVSGSIMPNGTVVFISGETGAVPEISLGDASTEALSRATIGLTTEEIAVSGRGYVTTIGLVRGVNTFGFASGAVVWLSETAGEFTDTKPSTPAHAVMLGTVNRVHATEGEILLNIANGWETYELHDVDDNIPSVNGQNWTWDVASGYYKLRTSRLYDDNNWSFQPGTNSTTIWHIKDQSGNVVVNYDSINNILGLSGVDPEIRITNTNRQGSSEYTRIIREDTNNTAQRFNRISLAPSNALSFDGNNEEATFTSQVIPPGAKSISFWFKSSDTTTTALLDNSGATTANHGTSVLIEGGKVQFFNANGAGVRFNVIGVTSIDDNTWHHGALTWDGTTGAGKVKVYIGGSEDKTGTAASTESTSSTHNLKLANFNVPFATGFLYTGLFDEMAIWSRELTADDVSDLFNAGAGLYIDKDENFPTSGTSQGLNLEALWHFDEESGSSLSDSSDNSNTGTLVNMEDEDWVPGFVVNPSISEVNVWKSENDGYVWGDSAIPTSFEGSAFGFNNTSPIAFLDLVIPLATQIGLKIKAAISQSADLLNYVSSASAIYSGINNIGERFNFDNVKNWFGTGNDASTYYDGVDVIINPKEVGTGQLKILGHALFDTSHGELKETGGSTDITISTPGTYVQWVNSTVGFESGAGYVVGDTGNDRLTIGAKGAGRYKVSYHSSVILEPGQCLEAAVFKNGTIIPNSICRQTSADNPHVHADSVSLVTGTLISGDVTNTQSWDGTYYVVQEIVGTPGLVYDFTFTDAEKRADIFEFRGRYDPGSAVHNIKSQAYNNTTATWINLTSAADDLPAYSGLDYVKRFKIPGTLADYYDGSNQILIRITHVSNGTASHQVHNDEVSMIREKSATIMNWKFYDAFIDTDYVDLRFNCPINSKVITPSETNLSIERMNRQI